MGFHQNASSLLSLSLILASLCCRVFPIRGDESRQLYIAYMQQKQHEDPDLAAASHHEILASVLGSKEAALDSIVYSYKHGFSGFSAMLTDSQAKQIAGLPSVLRVQPSRNVHLQTTRSWEFLGIDYKHPTGLLQKSNSGEDIIIGVIDTGIWPESKSFNDDGYGPVPSRWKGVCQTGQAFAASNCNRKIIGARWYAKGIDGEWLKKDYLSPRGMNPHGTHTASTALGTPVEAVSFHGLAPGTARGGAPRARLAVYKVLWGNVTAADGNSAALLAAVDDAIHDGVDVLSLSLAIPNEDSYGLLRAVTKGITVVYAAGNSGPAPGTVVNTAPWVITVAASTIDRSYPTAITLGNNHTLAGQALYYGPKDNQFRGLVYGASCNAESLNGTDVKGKVVLCAPSPALGLPVPQFTDAARNVVERGGKGLIFAQYPANLLVSQMCEGIACVLVDRYLGTQIGEYMQKADAPVVKLSRTVTVVGSEVLSPKVAGFSSRGPSVVLPEILKPDIAAPGVNILAAVNDTYWLGSGTSAATPHVAGVAALLKSLHPDWSPAAIKSALVTTASTTDSHGLPIKAEGVSRKPADPFDFGGGHIDPNRAADPGLVYDINPSDYEEYARCSPGDVIPVCEPSSRPAYNLNLPSISIPNLRTSVTVSRTVTNVGQVDATYKAVVEQPLGVDMVVKPLTLVFNATAKRQTFKVTFSSTMKVQGDYMFGSLAWSDGKHRARIPIAVRTVVHDSYADVS